MTDRVVYLNSELFYYKEGTGSKTMLLFHGFGQDHGAFETWNEFLQEEYTVYTFDLFFHGRSKWENRQALRKEDWKKILLHFFEQEQIDRFEIAGFSMGAKFVWATLALFPERIEKIILLAPDGIYENFWYRLATSTPWMRLLFRNMTLKPKRLRALIQFLKFFHVEDKNLLRFAEFQLSTEEKRQRVYRSWVYFRLLQFDQHMLRNMINSRKIPVTFILGKSDNVIPAEKIKAFAKTLNNHQLQIIRAGHHDVISLGINHIK